MRPALYECGSLQQRFGSKLALDLPALVIEPGRSYTLAGPNGSGKSTLLAILAFLARPSSGRVRFDGEPVSWSRATLLRLRRQVTLVHQSPYLFSGTVADNLAIALEHRSLGAASRAELIVDALATVELAGFERRDAKALSGGEAQRVAVARALLLRPRVLLLDEPFSNVDRRTAAVMERVIRDLPAAGCTVVTSSHDPELPARLGSDVVELRPPQAGAPPASAGFVWAWLPRWSRLASRPAEES